MQNNDQIKKRWLVSLKLFSILNCIDRILSFLQRVTITNSISERLFILIFIIIFILLMAIPFWVIYYFAYKKGGTKLLAWQLVLGPLMLCGNIAKYINEGSNTQELFLSLVIFLPFYIFYYICSYQLYELNKTTRQINIQGSNQQETEG